VPIPEQGPLSWHLHNPQQISKSPSKDRNAALDLSFYQETYKKDLLEGVVVLLRTCQSENQDLDSAPIDRKLSLRMYQRKGDFHH